MSHSVGMRDLCTFHILALLLHVYLWDTWPPHCLCSRSFFPLDYKNRTHQPHKGIPRKNQPLSYQSAVEFSRNSKHDILFSSRPYNDSVHLNFSGSDNEPLWMDASEVRPSLSQALYTESQEDMFKFYTSPPVYDTREFTHFNVGVLLVSGTGSSFDLEKCSPAVDMALDYVNEVYLKPHKVVIHKIQNSYPSCDNTLTPGLSADMKFLSNVIAFIGPACGFALDPVARLAAFWNIPIVTGLGDQPPSAESEVDGDELLGGLNKLRINNTGVFGDKTEYPTLTRLSYCQCRLTLVFDSICKRFGWKHLAIVYDKTDLFSFTVGRILLNGLENTGYEVHGHDIYGSLSTDMDVALKAISSHARIVILSLSESLVREFMLRAHANGYTKGGWVFMDVELFKNKPSETNFWQQGDVDDLAAKEAYEALLTVSLLMPKSPIWNEFSRKVQDRALKYYGYTFPEDEEVNFFIGAFYDGVILLGMALNETLSENGSILDGRSVTLRMWNRTIQGVTGKVTIDGNGDRDADYSILDMNPATGHFEVVAHYYSAEGLKMMQNRTIKWTGKDVGPPPDVPYCGFMGNDEKCVNHNTVGVLSYIGAVIGVFIVLIGAVIIFVYRHMREVEAASSTRWRIYPNEIIFDSSDSKTKGLPDDIVSSTGSVSIGTATAQTTFAPTATYKGVQVAYKKVQLVKRIEFSKQIVSEIRQIRDIQHENTCRLVGLCLSSTDPKSSSEKWDQILILTEYCTRGSLRDVLCNNNIHLDWPFRLSLISDIVQGMNYLHSNIGVHGRLKSTKLLVDARFVVKISDIGLTTIHGLERAEAQELDHYASLLWVAPEHLSKSLSLERCSIKGDVYSFGIILYEIATRSLPYFQCDSLTPEDIIQRVASHSNPPFRPDLSEDCGPSEIRRLIQICWADNPDDRPDFPTIKHDLKKTMKGAVHLVDDLLKRLEQHASHLESLVDDKTRELEQEKKRSEELLYQVLPRQVAEQLLRGETVIPESFDAVTIYFSDIVGFTTICAKSTPIQVVDFLNHVYGSFDGILDGFDAYKVETIGDAYMVVSGAPRRNGDKHVSEIAYLSLAVLDTIKNYEIDHLPEEQLKIRIGIHTGPVCAGVVGHRMPHYCLFGDTVNTASRMESSGQPLKIHVSEKTAERLIEAGGFFLTPRGEVLLKGKGVTKTYWLDGCEDESNWHRTKGAFGSMESLDSKGSVNSNHRHNSIFNNYSLSPSNKVTMICVTPAE